MTLSQSKHCCEALLLLSTLKDFPTPFSTLESGSNVNIFVTLAPVRICTPSCSAKVLNKWTIVDELSVLGKTRPSLSVLSEALLLLSGESCSRFWNHSKVSRGPNDLLKGPTNSLVPRGYPCDGTPTLYIQHHALAMWNIARLCDDVDRLRRVVHDLAIIDSIAAHDCMHDGGRKE